jgi:hypothetical protein
MRKPLSWYKKDRVVTVNNKMQTDYSYILTENPGKNFDKGFKPEISPIEMLIMGIFEGKYLNDCFNEYPIEFYNKSKLSVKADPSVNLFKIKSRQSLSTWRKKKWIIEPDPRGWFEWYCRYWLGRRIPAVDKIQIARHNSFVRHRGQINASIKKMKVKPTTKKQMMNHRPKQRQALLQWAYDPFK